MIVLGLTERITLQDMLEKRKNHHKLSSTHQTCVHTAAHVVGHHPCLVDEEAGDLKPAQGHTA